MSKDDKVQIVESYLVIIRIKLKEKNYSDFINNSNTLKKYIEYIEEFGENSVPDEILDSTYEIVENKAKSL